MRDEEPARLDPINAERVRARVQWIDATKGVAIVLVVFGHVLGGIMARGWILADGGWRGVYDFIYLFHMPVFFMISGLLLAEAASARPLDTLVGRIGSIVWPYLLWDVALRWALLPYIGRFMSSVPEPTGPLELMVRALMGEVSWFFWTLFMVQAAYIALARLTAPVILAGSIVLYVAASGSGLSTLQYVVDFLPFLALGAAIGPARDRLEIKPGGGHVVFALTLYALLAVALAQGWAEMRPVKLACNFAGIAATILIVQCVSTSVQSRVLVRLGAASLAIYVLHPYFQGTARAVVGAAVDNAPYLQLATQTVTALAGPLLVWTLAERLGASWLFRIQVPQSRRSPNVGRKSPIRDMTNASTPPRRVVYICDWLPPDYGAVGQYSDLFARQMAEAGAEVMLAGLTTGAGSETRERLGGGSLTTIKLAARSYEKSRVTQRMLWTARINTRLVARLWPHMRRADDILFTGSPPLLLHWIAPANLLLRKRLIYRITDFHPECLMAAMGRLPLSVQALYRLTLFWRRRVDEFEILGEDQRRRLEDIGIGADRPVLDRKSVV